MNQPVFSTGAVCQKQGEAGEIVKKKSLNAKSKIGLCLHWKHQQYFDKKYKLFLVNMELLCV